VSTEIVASIPGESSFREKMLITHRGLSGPAMLQISSYWRKSGSIRIDLAPDRILTASLSQAAARRDIAAARAAFRTVLPHRLADRWLDLWPPVNWTNHGLAELERRLHSWRLRPKATKAMTKPK